MIQTENFHTHTWRCHHADGTEREYVECAVRAGMTKLGFSDHAPYVFEDGYYSGYRIRHEDIESYFEVLTALKREFADRIEMHIGLEAEYYPKFFDRFLKLIEPYPVEYLLLGQHFLDNEMDNPIGSGQATTDEGRLVKYVEQTGEALATGRFACFAHPDVINFKGSARVYDREIEKLCGNVKKAGIPVEVNLLGIRTNRDYPNERFWRIAGEAGLDAVCGSDAHSPEIVYDPVSFAKAEEMAAKYGFILHQAGYILERKAQR